MNIGIIDADIIGRKKHRFPNLASMKLSSWHKSHNDNVKLLTSYDNINAYDKVYISKVFTDTKVPNDIINLSNIRSKLGKISITVNILIIAPRDSKIGRAHV